MSDAADIAAKKEEERLKRAFEKANNPALKAKEDAERQKRLEESKRKAEENKRLAEEKKKAELEAKEKARIEVVAGTEKKKIANEKNYNANKYEYSESVNNLNDLEFDGEIGEVRISHRAAGSAIKRVGLKDEDVNDLGDMEFD
eukprot:TRINITY_DN3133_c0_g1_i1.p1 TRINITY_DN3133_c0_g1~~TRINITY_DN3133_c0_g1_i1.p1  ORF type:complete len:144 (+),score=70.59 TRINITY_DN3133_c0_g1_i1:185-616(+)